MAAIENGTLLSATWLLAAASAVALGGMAALWVLHLKRRDAGIVDVGWAGILGLLALLYGAAGPGWAPRRAAVALLGGVWGLRLAGHLLARMRGRPEEGRYAALREEWRRAGGNVPLRFLAFFLAQGVLDVFLSIVFLFPALNVAPRFSFVEGAGLLVWTIALAGESFADAQLSRFKADPANRGAVCRAGLWNLSRHPNYFFEWLVWVGFAIFALGSPRGALALASPALMLFFLLRVTGIPATEAQALRTRGEAYRRYQREVSAFVPWFPRSA
jgi:steroid 5-alpha reductase family enzyme